MAKQQLLQIVPSEQSAVVYGNLSYSSKRSGNELDAQHPALLGHYHDLEKIGHGAQATMLKALDNNGTPVAIKIFEYQKANEWKEFELFEREISVLKDLDIDGVPKYIETIKTNRIIYLVEEYIDALSLEKQLNKGRIFSLDDCLIILRNTAKILQSLANRIPPIVHRDIKPANILADEQLNIYLVDFGVVANTVQTVSMTFAGTAGYVAPEQLYGKTTPASDIFSLGATMLHLVTRVAPCDMKLKGFLPDFDKYIPSSVPGWFSDLIMKMMSPDPESRPQNGDALVKLIEAGQARYLKESEAKKNSYTKPAYTQNLTASAEFTEKQPIEKRADTQEQSAPAGVKADKPERYWTIVPVIIPLCFAFLLILIIMLDKSDKNSHREVSIPTDSSMDYSSMDAKNDSLFGFGFIPEVEFMSGVADYSKGDYTSALKHLKTAASFGYKDAQYKLGQMYAEGDGVEKNYDEALNWYKKAAEQGELDAQYALGCLYSNPEEYGKDPLAVDIIWGNGEFRHYDEAVKWYKKAAESGHLKAQYRLGYMYSVGEGVSQDFYESGKWYKKAAEQGDSEAQYSLGLLYLYGGVEKYRSEAVIWLQKAAKQGHLDAQYQLGRIYATGDGVEKDDEKAVKWLQKAADQGHADARQLLLRFQKTMDKTSGIRVL